MFALATIGAAIITALGLLGPIAAPIAAAAGIAGPIATLGTATAAVLGTGAAVGSGGLHSNEHGAVGIQNAVASTLNEVYGSVEYNYNGSITQVNRNLPYGFAHIPPLRLR